MSDPSADDVRRANMNTLADSHVVYIEAIRKLLGDEGLKTISEVNRLHGLVLGKEGIEQGGLRKGDFRSIYEFFDAGRPYFGFDLSITDQTDKRIDLKVVACPWIDSFRARNAGPDICEYVTKIDEGIGQAVDPDLSMSLPKCMMRGDGYCIYRFEKE